MNYYKNTSFVFRAVSRLDKYTSGIVVVAKNADAAFRLCRAFEKGEVKKTYLGICEKAPCPPRGEINAPIARGLRQRYQKRGVADRKARRYGL